MITVNKKLCMIPLAYVCYTFNCIYICFGRRRITKSIVRNFMKKNKQLRIIGMTK